MSKRKKYVISILALSIAFLIALLMLTGQKQYWKLFSQTINVKQFETISQSENEFVGMEISDVLKLVTKNGNCFVFTRNSICMGMSYSEVIRLYPEMSLTPPRDKLYCVAVSSAMSPEEIYPRGFFVDENDVVIEPPITVSIYW